MQWVSRVHYHEGLIQICLQEGKREHKSTQSLVFVLKVERKTTYRAEVPFSHKVKCQNAPMRTTYRLLQLINTARNPSPHFILFIN